MLSSFSVFFAEENLSNYEPSISSGRVSEYEEEDDHDRQPVRQYNYTNAAPRRRTTVEKADRVQMGNVYHGPVTFVTYLPESSSKSSAAIKAPPAGGIDLHRSSFSFRRYLIDRLVNVVDIVKNKNEFSLEYIQTNTHTYTRTHTEKLSLSQLSKMFTQNNPKQLTV